MSVKAVTFLLCAVAGSLLVTALPRLASRQLAVPQVPSRAVDNACKNYMESCVPWESNCCQNMDCMNLSRGYCLYPLEKCLCQKVSNDFY